MDAVNQHRIYNQSDPQGNSWQADPERPQKGWTREITHGPINPNTLLPIRETITADPQLANRLNYQASSKSVELALHHAPQPNNIRYHPST